ncbi:capping protein-inhibiting regulator of actin dynamics [Macrotis lagotis]|uniref:capping protein-inhibiting regulator of actin dynamics n=1 Tax=Macrotis lagotis TaxID=92651 RepID=UPI003D69FBDE
MGTRAFSHDSIFIPDGGAESEQAVQAVSQDNILDKVKTHQPQLGKNIKFGQSPPPTTLPMKRTDTPSPEVSFEDDLFLSSPMEIVTHQDLVLSDSENKSSDTPTSLSPLNLPGTGSEMEEKVAPVKSSRPKRHFSSAGTIESVNLDAIPRVIARLDNSAAKHKLAVKPKNQRVSKKHRRLPKDQQNDQESLESQLSLDQNGHLGEETQSWHEEEHKPLDSEEEKRQQEEYWRHLEAEYRRQKAEKKRLEEQRLQEVERRLWEENQKPLLEEEEEGKGKQQHLEGQRPKEEERLRPEEQNQQELEENRQKDSKQEPGEGKGVEVEEQSCQQLETEKLKSQEGLQEQKKQEMGNQHQKEETTLLEGELKRQEETEEQERQETEMQHQEEEATLLQELQRQEETEEQEEVEKQHQEEEEDTSLQQLQSREETEEQRKQRQAEKGKVLEMLKRQEEAEKQRQHYEGKVLEELEEQDLEIEQNKQEVEKHLWPEEREEEQQQKKQPPPREALEEQSSQGLLKHPQGQEAQRQPESRELSHLEGSSQVCSQKNLEEQKWPKHEGHEQSLRGLKLVEKQSPQAEGVREGQQTGDGSHAGAPLLLEEREETQHGYPQKEKKWPEDELAPMEKKETVIPKKDQIGEELRWQEVEERQTMPRPYTFQVSSGGKQILFPKVNLSPVTLGKGSGLLSISQEPKASKSSKTTHPLPSSLSIPHTAILVTGAQLCGPAVNLNQIKDPACKTLLGLSEEKKHMDIPALENTPRGSPDMRAAGGKAKFSQESSNSKAALAEWESIRSRILKNTDNGHVNERDPLRHSGEGSSKGRCDSRGNLRKTLSANAKFSIMPAWQKFSDGSGIEGQKQNAENLRNKPGLGVGERTEVQPPAGGNNGHQKLPERTGMQQEPTNTAEGYKFAKDLPSFLVPSSPLAPQKTLAQTDLAPSSESEASSVSKAEDVVPGEEESTSPFGIKLRRTNYSLRFHYDQQAEQSKKKKRHSTGDSSDGVASLPKNKDGEKEIVKSTKSPTQETKNDSTVDSPPNLGHHPTQPASPLPSNHISSLDHDKPGSKSPLPQKPALAPKPTSQTPPSSPLSKMGRPFLAELLSRRAVKPDHDTSEKLNESKDSDDLQLPPVPHTEKQKEEETAEKKSPSPCASISQQEKPDKTLETVKKEKPVLQSWHSLEGSKSMEKPETAQPQWVTLALQKQKGFREQQATREERKQARETKQAERVSKTNAGAGQQSESSFSRIGSLHKSTAQEDEKMIETAVSRLERREQLKKSNTLPTSGSVDISDSAVPASLMKEAPKRFSTPDAAPVSTEPAWLALAKRKAKAWSDCPQIIK